MVGHTRLEIMKRCRREGSNSINTHHVRPYFSIILFPVFTSESIKSVGDSVGDNYFSKIKRVWNLLHTL